MSLINFKSLSEIKENEELERQARQNILDKAKQKYENELWKEKEAKESGERTWMLPAVEDKINSQKKKKKKKKKEKRNQRKEKKSKKKRKLSSSLESEEGDKPADIWVEKSSMQMEVEQPPKREEWMELTSLFKTRTREQMKIADGSSRTLKKLKERECAEEANKPGSHPRELNPYYKEGGTGLPSIEPSSILAKGSATTSSYDALWLKKALQRAEKQAAEEGRLLEEVAKERWGSLETFYKLLDEAEGKLNPKERMQTEPTKREMGESRSRRRSRSRDMKNSKRDGRNESRSRRSRSGDKKNRSESINRDRRGRSRSRERSSSGSRGRSRIRSRSTSRDKNKTKRRKASTSSSSSNSSTSRECNSSKRKYKEGSCNEPIGSRRSKDVTLQPNSDSKPLSLSLSKTFMKPNADLEMSNNDEGKMTLCSVFKSRMSSSWRKKIPDAICSKSDTKVQNESNTSSTSDSESSSESEKETENFENLQQEIKVNPVSDTPLTLLTDKEMNQLAAKLTKAELLGNEAQVIKLKSRLEAARAARENYQTQLPEGESKEEEQVVILTRTDKTGFTRPIAASVEEGRRGKKTKKKRVETFDADGKRISYYADDFKVDLHNMFEKEKTTSAADQIAALEKLSCANMEKLSDDFDVDDMFITKVAPRESGEREKERERQRAIWEHQRTQKTLDSCHFCVDNKFMKKHLIVALGSKCYLSLPYHQSLTEGHCLIVPLHHIPCCTRADEDLWEEIMSFRQSLVRMFSSTDEDCIFFETVTRLHQTPHMALHCVPLPKETGELAPIYFKKAILECDEEWAQNKKLVELKGRNVRQAIPKGLPYFFVDFGMTPGFAHVIENERLFPSNFAQEIIGGMIDADISLFRKPRAENFDAQRKKVLKFAEQFKPFDPTQ